MANNWAIVIGINQYRFLQPLKYAKRDAEVMHSFLMQEAKFDRIFLFTDDSPEIGGKSTEPFRANLLRVLRQIFATPFMKDGDNFWFFFSGHGIPHNGQDYLMPLDGDPEDIENTGISTNAIANYLRGCGADNAVMILDACRSGGKKSGEGIGRQTEAEARQTGVISLFSCSPEQYSYEVEAIEQGAFTYALLEGLGIRGRCATVERLNQYLEHRVPELVTQFLGSVRQVPYSIAEPLNRSHLILMPQYANLSDIATLKNDAYRAERNQDWDLAQRLWIRVNAAASGQDMDAIEALQNLGILRHTRATSPQPEPPQTPKSSKVSSNQTPLPQKNTAQRSTPTTPTNSASTARSSPVPVPSVQSPSRPSSIPVPRSPSISTAGSPSPTRRQVLKWAIPAGIGVVGVSVASQFLGRQSPPEPSKTQASSGGVSPVLDKPIVMGFIYVGSKDDYGWNQAQAQGAATIASIPGMKVIEQANVPETKEVQEVMRNMIDQDGATVIVLTSFGYFDPHVLVVSKDYPEVQFFHCGTLWKEGMPKNVGSYFAQIDEGQYLAGRIAAQTTKTGKLGFVGAKPINSILRNINSFILGARSIKPNTKMWVIFTGDWSLPVREAEAANSLADQGVDVVAVHVDSPKVVIETAEKRGIFSSGLYCDQYALAPKGYLTGTVYSWSTILKNYLELLKSGKTLMNGGIPHQVIGGLKEGYISLAPFGPAVSEAAKKDDDTTKAKIVNGSLLVYTGAVVDNTGAIKIPAGTSYKVTDAALTQIDWLAEGVIGKLS